MNVFIPYLLKLSICLVVVYLFYQLVLRRLTFYTWNRWYLLLYSLLAFFLPFVNLYPVLQKNEWTGNGLVKLIPAVGDYELMKVSHTTIAEQRDWTSLLIISFLSIGMLFMLVRLAIQYISLLRLRRSAQLILDDSVKVYQVNRSITPFSFGNAIYVNQHLHNEDELKEIIRHEFVHVKQRHSLDIIWMELFCLLNWYNPFAWMIRKAMRQNLEFIADRHVLQNGLDRKQYQYLLLKVTGGQSFSIASNFNFSSLKKRIAMMNRTKSARVHLTRFLFILPMLIVVLVAFRNTVQNVDAKGKLSLATDTVPTKKIWDRVSNLDVDNGRATVTLKNGQVEKYNLNNAEEQKAFEKKYGKLPEPPEPPVPASADMLPPPGVPEAPAPLVTTFDEMPAPAIAPEPMPAPEPVDCFNKKGYCITVADNRGECVIIVKDKNMKILEAVKLTDWNKDKKYQDKYGEIPEPIDLLAPVRASAASVSGVRTTISGIQARGSNVTVAGAAVSDDNITIAGDDEVNATAETISGIGATAPTIAGDVVDGGEEEIVAVIKSTTTREDLDKIEKDLKEKGYTLKIANVDFNDGKISSIQGSVTNDKGSKWVFNATHFFKVVLSQYTTKKGEKGFNVRVTDGKTRI